MWPRTSNRATRQARPTLGVCVCSYKCMKGVCVCVYVCWGVGVGVGVGVCVGVVLSVVVRVNGYGFSIRVT